jgi:flagellin
VQKLSSGKQINSAKDNAAGLGISEGVASIRNISDQSIRNLQNATSLVQTADGALDVVGKMLQRVLTLTTQKTDAVLNAAQTASVDTEITALTDEITRIKNRTTYNDTASVFGRTYAFGAGAGVTAEIDIPDMTPLSLGLQTAEVPLSAEFISDPNTNTFTISNHGYSTGDLVVYYSGTGDEIGNLDNAVTYSVIRKTEDTFQLALPSSPTTPIDITSLGTVADDKFQKLYGINEVGVNNSSTSALLLSQSSWVQNSYLVFNQQSALTAEVLPLVDGGVYQVNSNDGISVTLKNLNGGGVIQFTAGQDLTGSSLGLLDRVIENISSTLIDTSTEIFSVNRHGFIDGDQIYFKASGFTVGNLPDGIYYVDRIDNDNFRLATSSAKATANDVINLGNLSGSGTFELRYAVTSATGFTINPILQSNTLQFNSASGLSGGNQVIYRKAAGDTLIDPLVDGATYYLVGSGNTYQLSRNSAGTDLVTITTATGYSNSSFEKVTNATFNSSSVAVVNYSDSFLRINGSNLTLGEEIAYSFTGGTKISGLSVGNYYAIPINGNDFRLASSESNARAGIAIDLGTNGTGTDNFTKNSTITTLSVMEAIATNASNRASLGAQLNVLDYAIDNLQTLSNNLSEAYSRIVDTDYAAETSALTRNQILQQAATSMLAQANQMPNVILTLLK